MGIDPTILFTSYPLKRIWVLRLEEIIVSDRTRADLRYVSWVGGEGPLGVGGTPRSRLPEGLARFGWRTIHASPVRFMRLTTGNAFTGFGEPLPTNPRKLYISLKPMSMISQSIWGRYSGGAASPPPRRRRAVHPIEAGHGNRLRPCAHAARGVRLRLRRGGRLRGLRGRTRCRARLRRCRHGLRRLLRGLLRCWRG